jgi:hypothetical protein
MLDERRRVEAQREKERWAALSSEPPPVPILKGQRDLVTPIVIGCMAVIALVLSFVGVSYVLSTDQPGITQVDYTPQP